MTAILITRCRGRYGVNNMDDQQGREVHEIETRSLPTIQTVASVAMAILALLGLVIAGSQVESSASAQIGDQGAQIGRLRTRQDALEQSVAGQTVKLQHIEDRVDWIARDLGRK